MSFNGPLLSSKTDDWSTDPAVFAKIASNFNFALDVCASWTNHCCNAWYDERVNGLTKNWSEEVLGLGGGDVWMNPPYGRTISAWIDKALAEAPKVQIVCLLPARTDTLWWEKLVTTADEILFVTGRLRFGGSKDVAPFASAVVVLNKTGLERRNPNIGWVRL